MEDFTKVDMITASGSHIYFLQPELYKLHPLDIYIHAKNICRFNGAIQWSLLRHLALCVNLGRLELGQAQYNEGKKLQLAFIAAHDMHEIIVGDVTRGLKRCLPEYQAIEELWFKHFHNCLGLDLSRRDTELVNLIDNKALVTEMTYFHHPAAELLQEHYAMHDLTQELKAIEYINSISDPSCWRIVANVVGPPLTNLFRSVYEPK